jgi:hypothetical protein
MAKNAWIALVLAVMAMASLCRADDEASATDVADDTPGVTTIDELLADTSYAAIDYVPTSLGVGPEGADVQRLDLELEDNSFFGRAQRERSLALLTLSNQGRSRLFFGVNEKGLFGLHLTGTPKQALPPPSTTIPDADKEGEQN